jgi:hypothetical protein
MMFDFCDHQLHIRRQGGDHREIELASKPVAQVYAETMEALGQLGIDAQILPRPVEVERAIPFAQDTEHHTYDGDQAPLFWRQLIQADRVLNVFRGRFIGKGSPVHFFWGSFDLAVTRFSGRAAIEPAAAAYDADFRQYLLPYEAVRTSADPDATLLAFLETTYAAAADRAAWDRDALERRSGAA